MRKFLFAGLMLFAGVASAATVTVNWTHPTTYTDGSPLNVADISQTRIEYGLCVAGAFPATAAGQFIASGQATSAASPNLTPGTWCFRAYTTAKGVESVNSNAASFVVVQPAPNPPVLTTIATTAYELKLYSNGTLRFVSVGTVPLGAACGDHLAGEYAAFADAKVTKPTTGGIIAARCG